MKIRNSLLLALPVVVTTLAGCGGTTIKSDLVLEGSAKARLQLDRPAQRIELFNDSDTAVRVRVLDRKDRTLTNMMLSAHDQVQLDIEPASAVEFDNTGDEQAVVRWILRNNDRIEYSMAMTPD